MKYIIFFLLVLPAVLIGQTTTVEGTIVDSKDKGIKNVKVKVGNSIAVYTDANGTFLTKLSHKQHLNTRVKITALRRAYVSYINNGLIITDPERMTLDKIVMLREGEELNPDATSTIKDNSDLIKKNEDLVNTNQDIITDNMGSFGAKYQREIRDMEATISQIEDEIRGISERIQTLSSDLLETRDKDRFLSDLLATEQAIIAKQESIIASQAGLIQALSVQSAKGIALENARVAYENDDALEISFQFKDAFGNRPQASSPQVISIEVHQLLGKSRTKRLLHTPEDGNLESSRLRQKLNVSRLNTVRFLSPDAFKKKYRKMGYVVYFYLGETLLGVQGYRL